VARSALASIALSVIAILVCGAVGVTAGLAIARWLGAAGTSAALLAAVVAMPVAAATFALGIATLKRLRLLR
jgi:hypothetical protein